MKTIGIYYLCTGPYKVFWDDYYESMERYFLPDFKKRYFVFCDSIDDLRKKYSREDNVEFFHIDALPWPLITLLRFNFFLSIEDKASSCDYLMFSNANIACVQEVLEDEFLPRASYGETMSFVKHPGHINRAICNAPFERNRKSLAYVPYNTKTPYVIGAMFAGESDAFLRMSHLLDERIKEDLKKNIIARWHDESHLNRYVANRSDCRLLSPSYCYPFGFDLPVERKLISVDKASKFDVAGFKGMEEIDFSIKRYLTKGIKKLRRFGYLAWIRDTLMFKRIEVL